MPRPPTPLRLTQHLAEHRLRWHLLVPGGVSAVLLLACVAGPPTLRAVLHPAHARAPGLLDALQLLFVTGVLAMAWSGRSASTGRHRWLWSALAAGAAVVLLAELEIGLRAVDGLLGPPAPGGDGAGGARFVGRVPRPLVDVGQTLFVLGCVVLPLSPHVRWPPAIRVAIPSCWHLPTLGLIGLTALVEHTWRAADRDALAECRQLLLYYTVLLLLADLSRRLGTFQRSVHRASRMGREAGAR